MTEHRDTGEQGGDVYYSMVRSVMYRKWRVYIYNVEVTPKSGVFCPSTSRPVR